LWHFWTSESFEEAVLRAANQTGPLARYREATSQRELPPVIGEDSTTSQGNAKAKIAVPAAMTTYWTPSIS
jgi:hypothetical protein